MLKRLFFLIIIAVLISSAIFLQKIKSRRVFNIPMLNTLFKSKIDNFEKKEMARSVSLNIEGEILSVTLDDLHSNCSEPEICPKDKVTLRIDKIEVKDDPYNVTTLKPGDNASYLMKYSARRSKLKRDLLPECNPGETFKINSCVKENCSGPYCSVSAPKFITKPAEMENGFIIYHLPQNPYFAKEKNLTGLKEGSKIKYSPDIMNSEIGEYELIVH